MGTRIELFNNPVEHNPTPRDVVFIDDPELFKQTRGKLLDVEVIVSRSFGGIERNGYKSGTEASGSIEPGDDKPLILPGRLTTIVVRKV